jgi:tungstate transport system ATP-binding protein
VKPIIEARDLSLILSGKEVFRVEDFRLNKGEVMALVGPNGAGKSSLLRTLALLERPTGGSLLIDGDEAYRNGNIRSIRRKMAIVFQEALLLDTTVRRNVTIALRIRGIVGQEASIRTDKWLERFGVSHLARQSARHLSGGEAQRASLARAFALEPEILFLDEPFSALDYPTRKALLGEMGSLLKEMNMATLFVTHDYTEIPYLTSRVCVLFNGRIIKRGPVNEVFGEDLFQKHCMVPWETL